jgi:predicted  nucleic acid-binding Zn-ribbon protein
MARERLAKKVDAKYLTRYEMLRNKRNGLAVTGVTRGVCRGCNMNIPPQMFNQLLREQELLTCPTCNRMMYHLPDVEPR